MNKDKIKGTIILGDNTDEKNLIIENDEIIKSFNTTITNCLEGYICKDFVKNNLSVKQILFNCDMIFDLDKKFNIQDYEGDADFYSDYIDEQLRKINLLSNRKEVQAITEYGIKDLDKVLDFIIQKEYIFIPKNYNTLIAKIINNFIKDKNNSKKLKEEGVFSTSTGIIILNKSKKSKSKSTLKGKEIQLDVHFSKENGTDSEWVHFPMTEKEITRFMGKYRGVDSYIIDETSSNCGLSLYTYAPISPLENYVLKIQRAMEKLNIVSNIEDVYFYSKRVINLTPFNMLADYL